MLVALRVLFGGLLVAMVGLTTLASLNQGLVDAAARLWPDPWFRATLADAYFAFLTVYVWIAYKERSIAARLLWFVLVMSLGTIAISAYLLIQLARFEPGDPVGRVLTRAR